MSGMTKAPRGGEPDEGMALTHTAPNWTSGDLAAKLGAVVVGRTDLAISGPAALDRARPGEIGFIRDAKFAAKWSASGASAALVTRGVEVPGHDAATRALLVVDNADVAMVALLGFYARPIAREVGVHASAQVEASAKIAGDASVGPNVVIGAEAEVGEGATIMAGVVLGAGVTIGRGTRLFPGVVVYDGCSIGAECVLHANVVIGADGFGYVVAPDGRGLLKVPHVGTVEIHEQVEIGAGTCIDRGKFAATVIGAGTKIDNLVQIGHNARIGRGCVVCGCAAIAGSVTIGDGVQIGGGAGVGDNLTIGAGARLGAKAALMEDIPPGETWTGIPAIPARDQFRQVIAISRLAQTSRSDRAQRAEKMKRVKGGGGGGGEGA